jgi:pimeloyl-ACP methyl ester carboxylesterase
MTEPLGEPLVMVHGLGGSWDNWLPVLAPISRRRRCLVPDLPGFGLSPKPDAPYTVAWMARVLRDMLARAGALPAVLAGNSLGGHICLEYALRWPAEVRALILSAPAGAHAGATPYQRALLTLTRLLGRGPLARLAGPAVLPWFIRRLFFECNDECREEVDYWRHYLGSPEYPLQLRAAVRAAESVLASSLRGRLSEIAAPALIIAGRHDLVIPLAQVEEMARRLPRAELVVLEKCGHVPQVEQPERFVEEVERFLDGVR